MNNKQAGMQQSSYVGSLNNNQFSTNTNSSNEQQFFMKQAQQQPLMFHQQAPHFIKVKSKTNANPTRKNSPKLQSREGGSGVAGKSKQMLRESKDSGINNGTINYTNSQKRYETGSMNKVKDQDCNFVNQHLVDMVNDTPVKMTFTNTVGFTSDIYQNQKQVADKNKMQHAESYITNKSHQFQQSYGQSEIGGNMNQSKPNSPKTNMKIISNNQIIYDRINGQPLNSMMNLQGENKPIMNNNLMIQEKQNLKNIQLDGDPQGVFPVRGTSQSVYQKNSKIKNISYTSKNTAKQQFDLRIQNVNNGQGPAMSKANAQQKSKNTLTTIQSSNNNKDQGTAQNHYKQNSSSHQKQFQRLYSGGNLSQSQQAQFQQIQNNQNPSKNQADEIDLITSSPDHQGLVQFGEGSFNSPQDTQSFQYNFNQVNHQLLQNNHLNNLVHSKVKGIASGKQRRENRNQMMKQFQNQNNQNANINSENKSLVGSIGSLGSIPGSFNGMVDLNQIQNQFGKMDQQNQELFKNQMNIQKNHAQLYSTMKGNDKIQMMIGPNLSSVNTNNKFSQLQQIHQKNINLVDNSTQEHQQSVINNQIKKGIAMKQKEINSVDFDQYNINEDQKMLKNSQNQNYAGNRQKSIISVNSFQGKKGNQIENQKNQFNSKIGQDQQFVRREEFRQSAIQNQNYLQNLVNNSNLTGQFQNIQSQIYNENIQKNQVVHMRKINPISKTAPNQIVNLQTNSSIDRQKNTVKQVSKIPQNEEQIQQIQNDQIRLTNQMPINLIQAPQIMSFNQDNEKSQVQELYQNNMKMQNVSQQKINSLKVQKGYSHTTKVSLNNTPKGQKNAMIHMQNEQEIYQKFGGQRDQLYIQKFSEGSMGQRIMGHKSQENSAVQQNKNSQKPCQQQKQMPIGQPQGDMTNPQSNNPNMHIFNSNMQKKQLTQKDLSQYPNSDFGVKKGQNGQIPIISKQNILKKTLQVIDDNNNTFDVQNLQQIIKINQGDERQQSKTQQQNNKIFQFGCASQIENLHNQFSENELHTQTFPNQNLQKQAIREYKSPSNQQMQKQINSNEEVSQGVIGSQKIKKQIKNPPQNSFGEARSNLKIQGGIKNQSIQININQPISQPQTSTNKNSMQQNFKMGDQSIQRRQSAAPSQNSNQNRDSAKDRDKILVSKTKSFGSGSEQSKIYQSKDSKQNNEVGQKYMQQYFNQKKNLQKITPQTQQLSEQQSLGKILSSSASNNRTKGVLSQINQQIFAFTKLNQVDSPKDSSIERARQDDLIVQEKFSYDHANDLQKKEDTKAVEQMNKLLKNTIQQESSEDKKEDVNTIAKSNQAQIIRNIEKYQNSPQYLSPRSKEVFLIRQLISDCFKKYDKPPKTQLELYKIGKMLGKGAFGKVNLGLHRLTRKLCAIKSINMDFMKEDSQKRKIMNEINILKSLRHPNNIKILETFQTDRHHMIVMELCPGGDLLNYVRKRRKLNEKYAKFVFKQIMEGIAYLHENKVAHRDIKLDNILLDGHGNIKIGDFGVSKKIDENEILFEQCGTPAYIAPEIVKDMGYKGFPVDIWSAGICLYAMLYGNVPFKANQIGDLNTIEQMNQEIEYKDTASKQAIDLMKIMLQKIPKQRATAQDVLNHPFLNEEIDEHIDIFDEQELDLIRKEFTYVLQKRKLKDFHEKKLQIEKKMLQDLDESLADGQLASRRANDLNTEFTECSLKTHENSLMKNDSTKSVILCPFNTQTGDKTAANILKQAEGLMEDKDIMIRFHARVRELDRNYEKLNNQDFDNGVYHKYAYKQKINNQDAKQDAKQNILKEESIKQTDVNVQNLVQNKQRDQQKQLNLMRINYNNYYVKINENIINETSKLGFPQNYIYKCLKENANNHCTTTYYLLCMDQNF